MFSFGGLGSVEVTEYALSSSLMTRKVEKEAFGSGRYYIGPFNHFIRYPATVSTIQFSDQKMQTDLDIMGEPVLRSRTADGLDVTIELSFQYQVLKETLYSLYTTLGQFPEFHNTYVRVAVDRLTEIATLYTANEFFVDRTRIGKAMEKDLKKVFEDQLFGTIFSFQLRAVGLPEDFEDAIQKTEVMKQDVHVAEAEQNSTRVSYETKLIQAKRRVKVKENRGSAIAQATMLENTADIEQMIATQEKAADSFEGVKKALDDDEGDLLNYVQSRVVRDHRGDKTTVGLTLPTINSM